MTMADAFGPAAARDKAIVFHQTWGHLFPKGDSYKGTIVLAETVYGQTAILKEDIEIASSPWWYECIHAWADEFLLRHETGKVYTVNVHVRIVPTEGDGLTFKIEEVKP